MRSPARRTLALAAMAAVLAALGGLAALRAADPAGGPGVDVPEPRERVPRRPGPLASALVSNTQGLRASIDRWLSQPGASLRPAPREVALRSLYHQRIHILLSERRRLSQAVVGRLPRSIGAEASDLVAARRALVRLGGPPRRRRVRLRTGRPLPAGRLLRIYRKAQRRFGVSRRVLAAVNLVETGFNRLRNRSVAGARGPMQFLPATWRAYGMGGDIDDPHDAVMGAANYLRASGAPGDYRRALFAYNRSRLYVDAVLRYARRMRRDRRAFYILHSWQVFVRSPSGLRQLTGPGVR